MQYRIDLQYWYVRVKVLSKAHTIPTLPGFNSFRSGFSNQNDGVVAYVRDFLECEVSEPELSDSNCLLIKLSSTLAVVGLYRSPSFHDINSFLNSLNILLGSLNNFNTLVVIGDLNINISKSPLDSHAEEYLNLCAIHGLLPAHLFPTRNENCLDHVIMRSNKNSATYVMDTPFTDHCPILVCCELIYKNTKALRSITYVDESATLTKLKKTDFSDILNSTDPEDAARRLVLAISSLIQCHTRTITLSGRKRIIKPWITPGLLRCIRHRDKLYKKTKRTPNDMTAKLIYTRYRNFCNNLLRKIKTDFENNEFRKAGRDVRRTWAVIKRVTNISNENTNTSSPLLKSSNDPIESVNKVNEFFAGIGKNFASAAGSLEHNPQLYLPYIASKLASTSMVLNETDDVEVRAIIHSLKGHSAVGWDGITTSLLKSAVDILTPSITRVCNLCLSQGIFPKVFKTAIVHPIFKKGCKESVTNYRPISVLSSLSKILEKLINKRLVSYLEKYSLLACNQYGFRAGKSTEDALMTLVNDAIKNIDGKKKTWYILGPIKSF